MTGTERKTVHGIVVMKFGGTSLATPELRAAAAERVAERVTAQVRPVVVVSAMGRRGEPYATDTLLGLLEDLLPVAPRERDALVSCGEEISAVVFAGLLTRRGLPATSLRGFQAGIITDARHQEACITEIRPARIQACLAAGHIPVVAGFQGISADGEITTLGRGGSDTTAVAVGVALAAERVEIYTDVDGVLTADPRIVPGAGRVAQATLEEAAELAYKGADVLHPRAAELARKAGVPVEIRDTRVPPTAAGTVLVPAGEHPARREGGRCAVAVTSRAGIAQVAVEGVDFLEHPAELEGLFARFAAAGITLDMMSIAPDRVAVTLEARFVEEVRRVLAGLGGSLRVRERCARVTLVGGGIHGVPGVMHRIVGALARAGIGVYQSVDSNMVIGVLVDTAQEHAAVRAVHAEFFESRD
ncbi:MAG: aspartate kinase [Candidatus Eisenbacteria sp.]|nr:aspartate kinase [Candidatus Eisenbacteria bacterium]